MAKVCKENILRMANLLCSFYSVVWRKVMMMGRGRDDNNNERERLLGE